MKTTLVECGWGATRKKNGHLKQKYQRLMVRKGSKKALVAIGHDIIKATYFILKNKEDYQPHIPKKRTKKDPKDFEDSVSFAS